MKSREILYVTKLSDRPEKGLTYALYLANNLGKDLRILLVRDKTLTERFDDLMTAATFAEANEHETALEYLKPVEGEAEAIAELIRRCSDAGVKAMVHPGLADALASAKAFLAGRPRFDMVLLSPAVSRQNGILKSLVKTSSLPIVSMAG